MSKLAQQMSKQIQPGMKVCSKGGDKTPVQNKKCGGMVAPMMKKAPVKGKK